MSPGTGPDISNSAYLFPHIDKEGWKFGTLALLVAVALAVVACLPGFGALGWFVVPSFLLAYGVFLFFRDPERYAPDGDGSAILSPADGRVCMVEECDFPDFFADGSKHWRVSVFMSVFNVHVNRMPTAGTVEKKDYIAAGRFFNASLDKASKENERCNYMVKAENGQRYAVTQIAGLVARRIVPRVSDGDRLEAAQRFGLIRFGSRLDVYLPFGVEPEVRVGQTMVAGETVIGHLSRG